MKNPFAQLKSLPKNQRIALGVGGAGALGAGLYSFRKKKLAGTKSPASTTTSPGAGGLQSTLTPAPDLSQYGQVAVLVPIDWQDGANFGGTAGLTGPLNPSNPTNNPAPITTTPAPAPTGPSSVDQSVLQRILAAPGSALTAADERVLQSAAAARDASPSPFTEANPPPPGALTTVGPEGGTLSHPGPLPPTWYNPYLQFSPSQIANAGR